MYGWMGWQRPNKKRASRQNMWAWSSVGTWFLLLPPSHGIAMPLSQLLCSICSTTGAVLWLESGVFHCIIHGRLCPVRCSSIRLCALGTRADGMPGLPRICRVLHSCPRSLHDRRGMDTTKHHSRGVCVVKDVGSRCLPNQMGRRQPAESDQLGPMETAGCSRTPAWHPTLTPSGVLAWCWAASCTY